MTATDITPAFADEIAAEFGSELRVVSVEDWRTIQDAMALIKGRLSAHVDPLLTARINAVRVLSLTVEVSDQ